MSTLIKKFLMIITIFLGAYGISSWSMQVDDADAERVVQFNVRIVRWERGDVCRQKYDRTLPVTLESDRFPLEPSDFVRAVQSSLNAQNIAYSPTQNGFDLQSLFDSQQGCISFKQIRRLQGAPVDVVTLEHVGGLRKDKKGIQDALVIEVGDVPHQF